MSQNRNANHIIQKPIAGAQEFCSSVQTLTNIAPTEAEKYIRQNIHNFYTHSALNAIKTDNSKSLVNSGTDVFNKNALQHLIQIAFEYSLWDYVWLLLKQGANFPKGLNINLIPKQQHELLEFIKISQQYTELIKNNALGEIKRAIDNQIITPSFRSLNNQSAVSIAFYAKRYEIYVLLRSTGFNQFVDESPLEISKLPIDDQMRIKRAMIVITRS